MKRGLCLLLALLPLAGLADEAGLAELLGAHPAKRTGRIQLSGNPQTGIGLIPLARHRAMMLSGADGSLVKLQLQPKRIIMVSTEQRMYYWDPNRTAPQLRLWARPEPAAEQITLFRSILQGHARRIAADL